MKQRTKIIVCTSWGDLTLPKISEMTGIPKEIIRSRYYRGWRGDRLLLPLQSRPEVRVDYHGQKKSLREIAEAEGLSLDTITTRYSRGENGESLWSPIRYKKPQEYIGRKIGHLTIIDVRKESGKNIAICECDCGTICERTLQNLTHRNFDSSCGCHSGDWCRIHGGYKTREHRIWRKIIERCYNSNCKAYKAYGGRGILMCDEWHYSFSNFLNDMGPSPGPKHSIDRINNDMGYCKENCRWATIKQQARNKRNTIRISFNGKNLTIGEWAEELGVSYSVVYSKWRRHHDISSLFNN